MGNDQFKIINFYSWDTIIFPQSLIWLTSVTKYPGVFYALTLVCICGLVILHQAESFKKCWSFAGLLSDQPWLNALHNLNDSIVYSNLSGQIAMCSSVWSKVIIKSKCQNARSASSQTVSAHCYTSCSMQTGCVDKVE